MTILLSSSIPDNFWLFKYFKQFWQLWSFEIFWHYSTIFELWQLRTSIHDNHSDLTIESGTGQHLQFLQSFSFFNHLFLLTVFCQTFYYLQFFDVWTTRFSLWSLFFSCRGVLFYILLPLSFISLKCVNYLMRIAASSSSLSLLSVLLSLSLSSVVLSLSVFFFFNFFRLQLFALPTTRRARPASWGFHLFRQPTCST